MSSVDLLRRAAVEMANDNDDATWPFVADLLTAIATHDDEWATSLAAQLVAQRAVTLARVYLGEPA